jgi:hypothetical protein
MILYHGQTTRGIAVLSLASLRPTRSEGPVGHRARLVATVDAFPTWKEAQSPPTGYFS